MKRFTLILSSIFLALIISPAFAEMNGTSSMAHASQLRWHTKYSEALQVAKKENKPLLLFFTGSDWCGWCKKIESEVFADPEFVKMAGSRFVFVELDFPMNKMLPLDVADQNAQLKHKFGITGYPTIVIVNPDESFVAESGYRPGGGKAYAEYLLSLTSK